MSTVQKGSIVTRFVRRATLAAALLAAPMIILAGAAAAEAAPVAGASVAYHAPKPPKPRLPKPTMPTTPAPAASVTTPASTAPAATVTMTDFESQVFTLTNQQRVANGCQALRSDDRLIVAARKHSTDMVQAKYFSHTGSDGSDFVARELAAGYPKNGPSAENIAWGYRTPQDVVTGWMNSPGHRANILNCASTAIGVGVAVAADGSPYWTQDFGRI